MPTKTDVYHETVDATEAAGDDNSQPQQHAEASSAALSRCHQLDSEVAEPLARGDGNEDDVSMQPSNDKVAASAARGNRNEDDVSMQPSDDQGTYPPVDLGGVNAGGAAENAVHEDYMKMPALPTPRVLSTSNGNSNEGDDVSSADPPTIAEDHDDLESDDETWTPSIGSEEEDEDKDPTMWNESPIKYQDFSISFNRTDLHLEERYL